jgi:hypothetical protein
MSEQSDLAKIWIQRLCDPEQAPSVIVLWIAGFVLDKDGFDEWGERLKDDHSLTQAEAFEIIKNWMMADLLSHTGTQTTRSEVMTKFCDLRREPPRYR